MRPPGGDGGGGGGGGGGAARPAAGTDPRDRAGLGRHHPVPGLVQHRLVPDLHPFFPVARGPVGDCGGWPATGPPAKDSDDPIAFTQLADENWMGRCMVSLIAGTQESVNYGEGVHSPVASAAQVNMDDDQVQEQFMEEEEGSDEESDSDVEHFIVHCEGDTDVEQPTVSWSICASSCNYASSECSPSYIYHNPGCTYKNSSNFIYHNPGCTYKNNHNFIYHNPGRRYKNSSNFIYKANKCTSPLSSSPGTMDSTKTCRSNI